MSHHKVATPLRKMVARFHRPAGATPGGARDREITSRTARGEEALHHAALSDARRKIVSREPRITGIRSTANKR